MKHSYDKEKGVLYKNAFYREIYKILSLNRATSSIRIVVDGKENISWDEYNINISLKNNCYNEVIKTICQVVNDIKTVDHIIHIIVVKSDKSIEYYKLTSQYYVYEDEIKAARCTNKPGAINAHSNNHTHSSHNRKTINVKVLDDFSSNRKVTIGINDTRVRCAAVPRTGQASPMHILEVSPKTIHCKATVRKIKKMPPGNGGTTVES